MRRAVEVLQPQGLLALCPCRIYQRLLFASVFLFKVSSRQLACDKFCDPLLLKCGSQALAVGIVEHGQRGLRNLLAQAIEALRACSVDSQHIPRSFAALLSRLRLHDPNAPQKPVMPFTARASQAAPAPAASRLSTDLEDLLSESLVQTSGPVTDLPLVAPESFTGSTFFCTFPIPQNRRNNLPSSMGVPQEAPVNRAPAPFSLNGDMFGSGSQSFQNADTSGFGSASTPWDWDPYVGSMEAVREQENVFAGLWGTGDLTTGTTLVDTLGGGFSMGSM